MSTSSWFSVAFPQDSAPLQQHVARDLRPGFHGGHRQGSGPRDHVPVGCVKHHKLGGKYLCEYIYIYI